MLLNRQNGELAFKIFDFYDDWLFTPTQRFNYYTIILLQSGNATLHIDVSTYQLSSQTLIFISPYQPFSINSSEGIKGSLLHFHPDFFCTYRHQNEIETEGVLFNNIAEPTFFEISSLDLFAQLIELMTKEVNQQEAGFHEALVSYLKIYLISAVREKNKHKLINQTSILNSELSILHDLMYYINKYYRVKRNPSDYADLLHTSRSNLAKLVKSFF